MSSPYKKKNRNTNPILSTSLPTISKLRIEERSRISQSPNSRYLESEIYERSIYQKLNAYDSEIALGMPFMATSASRPSSLCVRCGENSSMCMQCSENLIESSLAFYKESRAKGAMALFNNAIFQAGAAKGLKFLVFRLWKNGFIIRSKLGAKKRFVAERKHRRTITLKPFMAWKQFLVIKENEKNDKKIDSLEKEVYDLKHENIKLKKENEVLENRVEHLMGELHKKDEILEGQKEILLKIYEQVAKERERLVGLCALVEPIISMSNIIENTAADASASIKYLLDELSYRPLHDYSRLFDVEVRDVVRQHRRKVITSEYSLTHSSRSETNDELRISKKIIFEWFNGQSRDAGLRTEPASGRTLARFLPNFERISDYTQLQTGRQLARVIMSLVHDKCDYLEAEKESPQRLSSDQWDDLSSSQHKPMHLIRLILKHAAFYLHIPLYRFEDILEGNASVIQSLVGHLLLCSAPLMHPDIPKSIDGNRQQCKAMKEGLFQAIRDNTTQNHLSKIFSLWKTLHIDVMCLDKGGTSNDVFGSPQRGPSLRIEDKRVEENKGRGTGGTEGGTGEAIDNDSSSSSSDLDEGSDAELSVGRDGGAENEVEAEADAGVDAENSDGDASSVSLSVDGGQQFHYISGGATEFFEKLGMAMKHTQGLPLVGEVSDIFPIFKLHATYDHLSVLVDDFLTEGVDRRLSFNVSQMGQIMQSLGQLQVEINHMVKESEDGIWLASDIRHHVVMHNMLMLLRAVKAVYDE